MRYYKNCTLIVKYRN